MPGARLVAQAPLLRLPEAVQGRGIRHDRPLAVFWLRRENLVVEVQPRPEGITAAQWDCRAPLWLRVHDLLDGELPMRVPVWAVHLFERPDLETAARDALPLLAQAARRETTARLLDGLVLVPSVGPTPLGEHRAGDRRVRAVGLDAAGRGLRDGMAQVADFLRACLGGGR
ncbi:hypothetical protein [Jannaschia sp. W003]|uniref:hypothetical protein n=1 Tax=Jannaschia sp. W003 TaxID=2867012 RepID=UPI0021A517A3|nr:hypothetical protein [Jannaschia sp. W003]UWQ23120.1 hypothetical protein K3554_16205 [Jannaschia sp. W003]